MTRLAEPTAGDCSRPLPLATSSPSAASSPRTTTTCVESACTSPVTARIADEAIQAAWVIAWKKLGMSARQEQLRPWLVAVAVNEAKQLLRKRRTAGRDRSRDRWLARAGRHRSERASSASRPSPRSGSARPRRPGAARHALRGRFQLERTRRRHGISPSGTRSRIERLSETTPRGTEPMDDMTGLRAACGARGLRCDGPSQAGR